MSILHWIGKTLLGLLLLIAYIFLVYGIYILFQKYLPIVIYGTWRSYVFYALIATFIEAAIAISLFLIGRIASFFYRPKLFRIVGWIVSVLAFVLSEIQLWQYINALYYAGFWEYFWGCILTFFIIIPYYELPLMVFYSPIH